MHTHAGTENFDPAVKLLPCIQKFLYGISDGKSAVLPEALSLQDSVANWALFLLTDELGHHPACSFLLTS